MTSGNKIFLKNPHTIKPVSDTNPPLKFLDEGLKRWISFKFPETVGNRKKIRIK